MSRRIAVVALLAGLAFTTACATNKKVTNPLADVSSKQPDKVLFDRAMDALKHNRFDVARLALETLINTYPDSEYIARAKLAVADSWYAEGGSTALGQAEIQYKDFITFFPNMPEAAEAQLKIANIHYQEMEKPDRDYTHAMRAEEEYRQLIMQWPDSKLIPEAKQRLRDVQEVIAEREFGVGHFYYIRESYPAAIARLQSLVDKYPLYSKADEALYLLGQSYEGEIARVQSHPTCSAPNKPPGCSAEDTKAYFVQEFTKHAAEAYDRVITRYPLMEWSDSAKARLVALHQPVPKPTKAAVAQNEAEEDSRKEPSALNKVMKTFAKHPDVTEAAKVGEPTMVDPTPVSASGVLQQAAQAVAVDTAGASKSVSIETVNGGGAPAPNETAPRSDAPPTPAPDAAAAADPANANANPAPADPNQLTPNAPADPNELKPNVAADGNQALPPPQQVNEIQPGSHTGSTPSATTSSSSDQDTADDDTVSSSKHKKKKGIHKIVPF